ncbi:terminase small subunit [Massilia sp. TS11]|uniref:terminase small subunit n=1 Tax=Massilia sp. TS11 TaxID=2908003 RepID=UPI001EDC5507|nr:terminase small subunit [Massilia sp. TS11]MCG2586505.1 terminase small subunit [Massilia sp. TS11]
MAGAKGRSGGARPGAGRKPKAKGDVKQEPKVAPSSAPPENAEDMPVVMDGAERDPLDFLLAIQNDPKVDLRLRLRASVAAAQYKHTKRADGGKKDEQADGAKRAATGRFAPKAPPKLVAAGGKKV